MTKSGQPPFQFEWRKNDKPLAREETISIGTTEDASMLIFRQLRTEDAGNYTCIVKNQEGTDSFTAHLKMKSESDGIDLRIWNDPS